MRLRNGLREAACRPLRADSAVRSSPANGWVGCTTDTIGRHSSCRPNFGERQLPPIVVEPTQKHNLRARQTQVNATPKHRGVRRRAAMTVRDTRCNSGSPLLRSQVSADLGRARLRPRATRNGPDVGAILPAADETHGIAHRAHDDRIEVLSLRLRPGRGLVPDQWRRKRQGWQAGRCLSFCLTHRAGYFLDPYSPTCVTPPFGSRDAGH